MLSSLVITRATVTFKLTQFRLDAEIFSVNNALKRASVK